VRSQLNGRPASETCSPGGRRSWIVRHGNIAVRLAPVTHTLEPVAVVILLGLTPILTGVSRKISAGYVVRNLDVHVEPTVVAHVETTERLQ